MNIHVYIDFDGTIMSCDTTDFLFERFALPQWRAVEEEWAAGRIGSRACMAQQVDLIRATPEQLDAAVAELEIDASFGGFLALCKRRGIGATVVSDGLDVVIESTMRRHGNAVPFYANHLVFTGGDRWRLEFPNARPECASGSGHCKCARTEAHPKTLAVVIGDGRSDFCIAGRADLVLAKSKLLEECRKAGLPHMAFSDFAEAGSLLEGWLAAGPDAGRGTAPVPLEV